MFQHTPAHAPSSLLLSGPRPAGRGRGPRWAVVAWMVALAGCATQAQYQAYVQRWSGASELELVRAWGPPQESYAVQGHKFLAYVTQRQVYVPAPPTMWSCPGWPAAPCLSPWPNPAGWIEQVRCKTVFELDQDRVIGSHWEGNGCEAPRDKPR